MVRTVVSALCAVLGLGVAGCVPDSRYQPLPDPVRVSATDVLGEWHGWRGSTVTLHQGGRAEVSRLDGQGWDFRDGWRRTGRGSWRLTETAGSAKERGTGVSVTVRTAELLPRPEDSAEPEAWRRETTKPERGAEYTWDFAVQERAGRLQLSFLTGDPDVRHYYVLERAHAGARR